MDIFFALQDLSSKYNDNFFVNLFGVWAASIFVELYEESISLYVCIIIYRKVLFKNVCSFDSAFKKLLLKIYPYPLVIWKVLDLNICFRNIKSGLWFRALIETLKKHHSTNNNFGISFNIIFISVLSCLYLLLLRIKVLSRLFKI